MNSNQQTKTPGGLRQRLLFTSLLLAIGLVILGAYLFASRQWGRQRIDPRAELTAIQRQQQRIQVLQDELLPIATPLHRKLAAVVLSEAWTGQEADIRWIYHNNVKLLGPEAGLKKSSAYLKCKPWFKVWLTLLGDDTYAQDKLPDDQYLKGMTAAQMCQTHYCQHDGLERGLETLKLVIEMDANPDANPYPGWIGQGNVNDMNLSEAYWKRTRQYYWLQEQGAVEDKKVQTLAMGKYTQFLFDGVGILEFEQQHPDLFPEDVPAIPLPQDTP